MSETELGRIHASTARRVFGAGSLLALGSLLIFVAAATSGMGFGWKLFLFGFGIVSVWGAAVLWNASAHQIVLTETALTDSDGTVIVTIDDIAEVDRSMFAMKPSNGFVIVLKDKHPAAWRPGLWWRWRRRVAIGGVVAGSQTKPVADSLSLLVASRD